MHRSNAGDGYGEEQRERHCGGFNQPGLLFLVPGHGMARTGFGLPSSREPEKQASKCPKKRNKKEQAKSTRQQYLWPETPHCVAIEPISPLQKIILASPSSHRKILGWLSPIVTLPEPGEMRGDQQIPQKQKNPKNSIG